MRDTGLYATRGEVQFAVAYVDFAGVAMRRYDGDPHTGSVVPREELDSLERVQIVATWRERPVIVQRILPNRLTWVLTRDEGLAAEVGAYGDASRGWGAAVPLFELDDVAEQVETLL